MKGKQIKKTLLATSMLLACANATNSLAHGDGAVMGQSAHFTAVADVTCFDDGNGTPSHLFIRIKDNSQPVPGLLLSMQAFKANKSISISTTDTISGDNEFSPGVELHGGTGKYTLFVNKTAAGSRAFLAEWHCETADNVHTGTEDIVVKQFQ